MKLAEIRTQCLARAGTTEERPFGPDTIVFKVMGKMFALMEDAVEPISMNLKCDPDDSLALRAQFEGVQPGYHMNKRHWVTITLKSDIPVGLIKILINDSYDLVVAKLPRKLKDELKALSRWEST